MYQRTILQHHQYNHHHHQQLLLHEQEQTAKKNLKSPKVVTSYTQRTGGADS
jgi:hypothetical protein